MDNLFMFRISLIFILLCFQQLECAKRCYSGQNARYAEKHCSSGSVDIEYTCQKFTCTGGKSPFTLRTCANKQMGCLAGPRICQFSGGSGQCQRCDDNLCNK
ncbi:hypothetical protein DdX_17175 [Ditylenchus destructor]|uniref:Uncharacterized protein n=1 Tax=Ditylenchus destructor TaxID=166010 RepID=A0AAD4MNI4_9BILA|nr:hypothetical protein DdX_17175 [Ditylenchus destructor]